MSNQKIILELVDGDKKSIIGEWIAKGWTYDTSNGQDFKFAILLEDGSPQRKRKPACYDAWGCYTPEPFSNQDIDDRMDKICGCKGKYDCDCTCIKMQAIGELWQEHNERARND